MIAQNVETGDRSAGACSTRTSTERVLGPQQIRLDCHGRTSDVVSVTGAGNLTVDF